MANAHDKLVTVHPAGGVPIEAQISKSPLLLFPCSQTRIHIVEPGVKPKRLNSGINTGPLSSSHANKVKLAQSGPVYTAAPPSTKTPFKNPISTAPLGGTTAENQTSEP